MKRVAFDKGCLDAFTAKYPIEVRVTEVVPAPDETVTAMMGCLADMMVLMLGQLWMNNDRSLNSGEL